MRIAIVIMITLLWAGLQNYLSRRDNFIFGLIIPALVVIGCALFLMFMAQPGTKGKWIFRFALLLGISLEIYFEGRKKIKENREKELEKMAIKDL